MEVSFKSLTAITAVVLTGLSSGFFYSWAVSVIPGTRRVGDMVYLETMQSINRAILNPAFYLIFFGSLLALSISTMQHYNAGKTFWMLLAALIIYAIGTFGVTALGNVPLNNSLDLLDLSELNETKLQNFRSHYESKWNRLHRIRTICSVASFVLVLFGILSIGNKSLTF